MLTKEEKDLVIIS